MRTSEEDFSVSWRTDWRPDMGERHAVRVPSHHASVYLLVMPPAPRRPRGLADLQGCDGG